MEEVEVTSEVFQELGYPIPHHTRKQRAWFLKGPIPFEWLVRSDVAPHTTTLALIVKALVDTIGGEPVSIPRSIWKQWGLARDTRRRAIDALEGAGIIRTERPPGQSVRIWLIDKP